MPYFVGKMCPKFDKCRLGPGSTAMMYSGPKCRMRRHSKPRLFHKVWRLQMLVYGDEYLNNLNIK